MANNLSGGGQKVAGLGTWQYSATSSKAHYLEIESNLPQSSGLQIVVKKNSTTLLTIGGASNAPTPTQPVIGGSTNVGSAAGDLFQFILTSSSIPDQFLNAITSFIRINVEVQ